MSAAGEFVPPGMIYPRMRIKDKFKNGAPSETKFYCQLVFLLIFLLFKSI